MPRCRWRRALAATTAIVTVWTLATARLFIWPPSGMPSRVDAIVMTAGPYAPLTAAIQLARAGRSDFLLISRGHEGYGGPCPPPLPRVRLICFAPDPATTQGEAEYVGRMAKKYGWHSVAVVTITPQGWRAQERIRRCFGGSVYGIVAGIPWYSWPYQITYQWGATIKMLVVQRAC